MGDEQAGHGRSVDLADAELAAVTVPERPYLRLVTQCSVAALEGVPDGAQQNVVAEWLCSFQLVPKRYCKKMLTC
jgi:hypothetical protein